jgi:hypothetical protein
MVAADMGPLVGAWAKAKSGRSVDHLAGWIVELVKPGR